MRIGGIGNVYPTYIYNPNTVSANSLNKLSKISDDVLDKKIDYTETEVEENQNPLQKGQTLDFEGILAKQMQQGQNRAARIMVNRTEEESVEQTGNRPAAQGRMEQTKSAQTKNEQASSVTAAPENNTTVMQMQRAIQAYEMFMTA